MNFLPFLNILHVTVLALSAILIYYVSFLNDEKHGNAQEKNICNGQRPVLNATSFSLAYLKGKEYFSCDYENARELFLESARSANAEILSKEVVQNLFTDVAIIRGNSPNYLFHISGTHGMRELAL